MAAPTVAEIQCGIGQTGNPVVAAQVQQWLDALLAAGHPSVIDFDAAAARLLGRMWSTPALSNFVRNDPRSTKHKSGADLAIAACAICRGMIIVTQNAGDFLEIHRAFALPGLFSPFQGHWHVDLAGPRTERS